LYILRHIIQMKIYSSVVSAFDISMLLLCWLHCTAPTGAVSFPISSRYILVNSCYQGKTDVAMLTILRVIDQHRSTSPPDMHLRSTIDRKSFKIIYVCALSRLIQCRYRMIV
jgi:hypothetical protein